MPKPVQLGTVLLRSASGDWGPGWLKHWVPTDAAFLDTTAWDADSQSIAELLGQCIRDSCLRATLERRYEGRSVRLRVSVIPNDNRQWNGSSHRVKRLKGLYAVLEHSWDGEDCGRVLQVPNEDLGTGMQALYALIDNPPEPRFGRPEFVRDEEVFDGLRSYINPPGVITALYAYQIRSVARMLQMETAPGVMVNPSYSRFQSADGDMYFVNLTSMDMTRSPREFSLSRGGILCEQMGVGKTLMCLVLILVSRHQHTSQPEGWDVTGLLNDDEVRTYSTSSSAAMRHQVGLGVDNELDERPWSEDELKGTPTLTSLCADIVSKLYPGAEREHEMSPNINALLERPLFFYRFPPSVRLNRRAKLVRHIPAEKLLVAAATLVVVPPILVPQWLAETEKHLVPDALRIKVIDEKMDLPPIEELIRHDIVIMSVDRFRREGKRELGEDPDTILLAARWKRIILDEGNNASNAKSDAVWLAKRLSIERRWIVSGTPTLNLKQGTESAVQSFLQSEGMQRVDSAAESRSSTPLSDISVEAQKAKRKRKAKPPRPPVPGKWSRADENDLERIGHMLSGFLASEIFSIAEFRKWVKRPLRDKNGPSYGAVERVRQLLSAVMVKHRPGTIDLEVPLPPSTLEVKMVRVSPWQRLTYNAIMGLVAANVFTSEGQDPDYLLHANNLESLNQVVFNMHLALTWFTSVDMDLEGSVRRTAQHLEKKGHKMSREAVAQVERALVHMREALDAPGWFEWMQSGAASIPFSASSLPLSVSESWSEAPDHDPTLVDAHALIQLRKLNTRGAEANTLAMTGWDERAKKPRPQELLKAMEKAEKAWRDGEVKNNGTVEEIDLAKHRDDKKAAADKPIMPKVARNKHYKDALDASLASAKKNAMRAENEAISRPLPSVMTTSSVSSKINWVVRTVLTAPAADQFLIFATWEESAHLSEAFELSGIKSVYAGIKVDRVARNRAIAEFKLGVRVCILELKLGGRGLDLTVVNRMIFLGPVWNPDIQAQAIKRIHRIGQTRPTHIDILVSEGTFEEDVVRRESERRSDSDEKRYSRALVENPRFVHTEATDEWTFPVSLVPSGTASEAEEAQYAEMLAAMTPGTKGSRAPDAEAGPSGSGLGGAGTPMDIDSDSAVTTTIATPTTQVAAVAWDVAMVSDKKRGGEEVKPAKPRKRIRFADDA